MYFGDYLCTYVHRELYNEILEEDVINTPHVFRGTCQVAMESKGSATTLSKHFHEKARFVLGVDLCGPQQPW